MENYKNEILGISRRYNELSEALDSIQKTITNLAVTRDNLKKELDANVLKEKDVINKIEESLGRKLTQEDLIDIVKNHKDEN